MYDSRSTQLNKEVLNSGELPKSRPELSFDQKEACRRIVNLFLDQPNFTIERSDAGTYVREVLQIESRSVCSAAYTELIKYTGIVSARKSKPDIHRPDVMELDIFQLLSNEQLDWVTPELKEVAREKAAELKKTK